MVQCQFKSYRKSSRYFAYKTKKNLQVKLKKKHVKSTICKKKTYLKSFMIEILHASNTIQNYLLCK